jgi:hypothetical protein
MIALKKVGRAAALAALFGAVLYSAVYFMASHSDAFEFAEQKIRNSNAVKALVGDIKKIRPALLGPFDQRSVNSDEWISMAIKVSGVTKSIEIGLKMKKTNGVWVIEDAINNGSSFNLD